MKTDVIYHRVRLKTRTENVLCNFEVIIADNTLEKIQKAISQSGFAVVDAEIAQIEKPAVKILFVPLRTLKAFRRELADLVKRIEHYGEILELNTFDPVLWRQQLVENSRANDLMLFRKKILNQIKGRYELS